MRARTLKAMNVLNMFLMMHIGHIGMLAEKINRKLLVIKMIEREIDKGKGMSMVLSNKQRNERDTQVCT